MTDFTIRDWIDRHKESLHELSRSIWSHPETAFQEHHAAETACQFLSNLGYQVIRNYCGFPTAWRTESECSKEGPVFALCAEYDALPEIGHGCGHNLICTAALAAFGALAEKLRISGRPGRIVLLGTPAEECGGGKVRMLKQNCLDDIDAVMMVHPGWRTTPDTGSSGNCRHDVIFHGTPAHAAASPELGRNALDAVMLLFAAVNAYRQQIPDCVRIHGIVTEGGIAPNIIPEKASCRFFLRSTDEEWRARITERFIAMVHGAELMTATRAEIQTPNPAYQARKPNAVMNQYFLEAASAAGLQPVIPPAGDRSSSDFGNFSRVRPGIHPYFAISETELASHSAAFCQAAGSDYGFANTLKAAEAMAETGWKFLTDEIFRKNVIEEFKKSKK